MRKSIIATLTALMLVVPATFLTAPVEARPAEQYNGPYFGENNLPPGCTRSMSKTDPTNVCYHMRTGLNALDSPQVDVLVMVPVSPTAERDMRIMRQSIQMWEAGIDYLANEMGLPWLAQGMDFHITVDSFDPAGTNGGEFTTYPIADPEIVVIATNPVGGVGIGIDPVATFADDDLVPCHGVKNAFDFEAWKNVPGFSSHHGGRAGTYVEDCGGAGGNICFAINGAIDPAPETIDVFSIFDLVSHEFGHCLTIGHVGDGAEGTWGNLPSNDIMAYSQDPPGLHKCVSTLDVEGVALRMSKYLDVNGDGVVDGKDLLRANDQIGSGGNPFQIQHPHDHLYASKSGSPLDCPQPDQGWVPGPRTNWTPTPVPSTKSELKVTGPQDGATSNDGAFNVTGTVEHVALTGPANVPTQPTGSFDDADNDAHSPLTEIKGVNVAVTPTHVNATISLAALWPSTAAASPTSYSLSIDGRRFDSFVRYPIDGGPMTWDSGAVGYLPRGASTWDTNTNTVSFQIPRAYLTTNKIDAPYYVSSSANFGTLLAVSPDDKAPESGDTIGVASARVISVPAPKVTNTGQSRTVTFHHAGGNTFYPWDSTLGVASFVGLDSGHNFTLDLPETSDVKFALSWTDVGGSDLDLYTSNARMASATSQANPENLDLKVVKGTLDINVDPATVTDAVDGATYTLTATITPSADTDGDGVANGDDRCPDVAAQGPNGCPAPVATEHVRVYVDGALVATQDVHTAYAPDAFDIRVQTAPGTHELRVEWENHGNVIASRSLTVSVPTAAPPAAPAAPTHI